MPKFHQVIAKKKRKTAPSARKPPKAVPEVVVLPPTIYVLSKQSPRSLNLAVKLTTLTSLATVSVSALLDSGAMGNFVSPEFVRRHRLETMPLPQPIPIRNVDGTPNENGAITEELEALLTFGWHTERARFAITNLGQQSLIIGHSWLLHHNPEVDWTQQKVTMSCCPSSCRSTRVQADPDLVVEPGDGIYATIIPPGWGHELRATTMLSQRMAQEAHSPEVKPTLFEVLVPEQYQDF
jgi:hypothetical protein